LVWPHHKSKAWPSVFDRHARPRPEIFLHYQHLISEGATPWNTTPGAISSLNELFSTLSAHAPSGALVSVEKGIVYVQFEWKCWTSLHANLNWNRFNWMEHNVHFPYLPPVARMCSRWNCKWIALNGSQVEPTWVDERIE